MFLGAEIQISVKLQRFKNIQIKQPCLLQIRLSIHHQDQYAGMVTAIPLFINSIGESDKKISKSQLNHLNNTYLSQKIPIRFQECFSNLNEMCVFKIMVDAAQINQKNSHFILLAELLLIEGEKIKTLIQYEAQTGTLLEHGYLPIFFDNLQGRYTCSLEVELHSQIIGLKFIDNSYRFKQTNDGTNKQQIFKQLKCPHKFKTFKQFLSFTTNNFQKEKVQRFYDGYVGYLRQSIYHLKSHIKQYIELLDRGIHNLTLQMEVIRKLSQPLPQPTYQSKSLKKKIFGQASKGSIKLIEQITNKKNVQISDYLLSPESLQECLLKDFNLLNKILYQLWRQYLKMQSQYVNVLYQQSLKQKYLVEVKRFYTASNCVIEGQKSKSIQHMTLEDSNRTKNKFIVSANMFNLSQYITPKKKHLIIVVHGFQACSLDLQILRNLIIHLFPSCEVLMSSANQCRTQNKIQLLGERLALQIKNYINEESHRKQCKISFIAHSLGGIIVRAALQYLLYYKKNFGVYISLSSPHLGYLFHTSTLIKTSLWVLNKMNKCQSLLQLSFQDSIQIQNSYLFKLSSKPGLQFFQSIILQGSTSDQYVPYASARMETCYQVKNNPKSKNCILYTTILQNIIGKVIKDKIVRVNVQFGNLSQDFNTMIGRTAHIQMLSDHAALKAFLLIISDVFV